MNDEKTPGRVSWTARNMALAGTGDQPGDVLAELDGTWDYLSPEERDAEEAGAQAVLDARTPWGDADITVIGMHSRFAVVRSNAASDAEVVKVIAWGNAGLAYYDSVEEWKRANEVTVAVAKVPSPTGTDMVRVEAVWPPGDGEWLVRMVGEDFADGAVLAGKPCWSWTGFLPAGSYSLHVEGFDPAPFEVTS